MAGRSEPAPRRKRDEKPDASSPAPAPEKSGPVKPNQPGRPSRPEQTKDDSVIGWGEDLRAEDPDDDARFLDNVPPHHGS